jgi:Domain of unknown function (DUF4276)
VTPSQPLVIEIIGDGKADAGPLDETPQAPLLGVVTLLAFRLCESPDAMHVRRRKPLFLQKATPLWRRVQQSKMRAADACDDGLIYVVDTEGEKPQKLRAALEKGRDSKYATFPTAVGVAHPCIEAWLLADAGAIQRAFDLSQSPDLPGSPEGIPDAPKKSPGSHYKRLLAQSAKVDRADLSAALKAEIVRAITDLANLRSKCPSFAAFGQEVEQRIKPLFEAPGGPNSPASSPG